MKPGDLPKLPSDPYKLERQNFIKWSLRRMWTLPCSGYQFAAVVIQGLWNRARRRWVADTHFRGKIRPNIFDDHVFALENRNLEIMDFPNYPDNIQMDLEPARGSLAMTDGTGDSESVFAQNRWGHCQHALFASDATVRLAMQQVVAWLDNTPRKSHCAWEPFSVAERVANLMVLLSVRQTARQYIHKRELERFLTTSLEWLWEHLEYYGEKRTNNHILNNARALVIAGSVGQRVEIVEAGLDLFCQTSATLFYPSGFLRERSSHYQVLVTGWLLDTLHFARHASRQTQKEWRGLDTVEKLARNVTASTGELISALAGTDSQIGDVSPDGDPMLAVLRIQRLYPEYFRIDDSHSNVMRDGWITLFCGDHRLVANCPPESFPCPFPTHGHSDLGHFIWIWRNLGVLADPGRARYTNDPRWVAQIEAGGHNLIRVNGLGPLSESLFSGPVRHVGPYSDAKIHARCNADGFEICHNGFKRVGGVGIHRREVRLIGNQLQIEDHLSGQGTVTIELFLHFDPRFRPNGETGQLVTSHRESIEIQIDSANGFVPDLSWHQFDFTTVYGQAIPAYVLRIRWRVKLPCSTRVTLRELETR